MSRKPALIKSTKTVPLVLTSDSLKALYEDEGRRRDRRARLGTSRIGLRPETMFLKPRRRSSNGSRYISGKLAEWLEDQEIDNVREAPNHPQTQSKIKRWQPTTKKHILLQYDYLPGALRTLVDAFAHHYKHRRDHEGLQNLTPAGVYFGRNETNLKTEKESN